MLGSSCKPCDCNCVSSERCNDNVFMRKMLLGLKQRAEVAYRPQEAVQGLAPV